MMPYKSWDSYKKFMKQMIFLLILGFILFMIPAGSIVMKILGLVSMGLGLLALIVSLSDYGKMKELK